jgi:hypothetical protein
VIGKLGGHEQIELAGLKAGMGRGGRVSARSAAIVDDWIDQGICDGSHAEVEVEEPPDIEDRAAEDRHIVASRGRIRRRRQMLGGLLRRDFGRGWGSCILGGDGGNWRRARSRNAAAAVFQPFLQFLDTSFMRRDHG